MLVVCFLKFSTPLMFLGLCCALVKLQAVSFLLLLLLFISTFDSFKIMDVWQLKQR